MFMEFGGPKRIVKEIDFILSFVLALIITIISYRFYLAPTVIGKGTPLFITVSGTMITIAIAGLAIISSLSDPEFLIELKKAKIFTKIMFMFYYSTMISGLSIISNLFTYLIFQVISSGNSNISFSAHYQLTGPHEVTGNATVTTITQISTHTQVALCVLLFFSLWTMLYSVFAVILLVGTTMRYGIYRELYYERGMEQ